MSKRDTALYVEDVLDSAKAIKEFVDGMSFEEFKNDRKTYSATIGVYGFRRGYCFVVDAKVIWDLTKYELDTLVKNIENFKESITK